MSKALKVGDIVEFNYDTEKNWNETWREVRCKILKIARDAILLKVVKTNNKHGPELNYTVSVSIVDPHYYNIIKNTKSHLPVWF